MNRSIPFLSVLLAACLLLSGFGCGGPSATVTGESSLKPLAERNEAPEFELKDENGKKVKLSDYDGQVVLLNFWATWCGPCKLEIPWFVEFEKKNRDRGFAVLGVSMDEDGWDSVKPYLEYAKVNYRVLMGTDHVAMMYGGVDSLPTTFLIDHEGKIAAVHIGLVSKLDYETDIQALLDQKTES